MIMMVMSIKKMEDERKGGKSCIMAFHRIVHHNQRHNLAVMVVLIVVVGVVLVTMLPYLPSNLLVHLTEMLVEGLVNGSLLMVVNEVGAALEDDLRGTLTQHGTIIMT